MPEQTLTLDSARLPALAERLRQLVASGELELPEAEAILETAVEAAIQDEAGTVTARRVEQLNSLATRTIIVAGARRLNEVLSQKVDQAGREIEDIKPETVTDPAAVLYDIYRWGATEQREIEAEINRMRADAYQAKLAELAEAVGCPGSAGRAQGPSGSSLAEMEQQSRTDAGSVVATWNREAKAQIERLVSANPEAEFDELHREMESWYQARDRWKQPQIGLMSTQTARNLAREDFYANNAALLGEPRFRFVGPPPREAECAELMALGVVGEDVVKSNPTPIHINCPHEWEGVQNGQVECRRLWVG